MIPLNLRKGQSLYVFGLGKSGLSAIAALIAGGAAVSAWDDNEASRQAAEAAGASLLPPDAVPWPETDAMVLSPGVPLSHPAPHNVVVLAKAHGVPVIGDTELFVTEVRATMPAAKIVAITGTNGKSTTTALIGHVLASAGLQTQVGGNIGDHAVLELKPSVNHMLSVYVVEFSSYQLDLTPGLRPDVAVFLNLSPDHLDRHGGFSRYAAVKAKIFAKQGKGDVLVLGSDDTATAAMSAQVPPGVKIVPISQGRPLPVGIYGLEGKLLEASPGGVEQVADIGGVAALRGGHNAQNAAAAAAVGLALGLESGRIAAGLATFGGLKHRMEIIGHGGATLFVNDSKATNADSAEKSLASFHHIHWIAGGRAKSGGIEALRPLFHRVVKAYLIGEAAALFAETLDGAVPHEACGTLEVAFERAAADAMASTAQEPVVLLAPACASFDQYDSFEGRGDEFSRLASAFIAEKWPKAAPNYGKGSK